MAERQKSEIMDFSSGRIGTVFNARQGPRNPAGLHFHPHFEMLYIIKGVREMEYNGVDCKAKAGDLIVFRPGDEHVEFMGTKYCSYFFLRFKPEELAGAKIAFNEMLQAGPVITLQRKSQFLEIFGRMLDEQGGGEESRILLRAYLVEFIVKLRRAIKETFGESPGQESGVEARILSAMDLIHKNLDGELDLDQIARRAFMSSSHFSHTFKERLGESPKRYQIRKRMEKAKELLSSTSMTAREIALDLGYNDPYFFYRQFRRKEGMTPSEFRRRHPSKK